MDREAQAESLIAWFCKNGGELHPAIRLQFNQEYGYHFIATSDVPEGITACKCPFGLSMSALNCMTPSPKGVRSDTDASVCVKLIGRVGANVVGVFFLAEQWLKGKDSFWYPYIRLLPRPEDLTTPLWFDEEDLIWLKGTNMYAATVPEEQTALGLRKTMYREAWNQGLSILKENGVDITQYSWELLLWAATIYSSRSFSSGILPDPPIIPGENSHETFPILYPVIDIFNHLFASKVSWSISSSTQTSHDNENNDVTGTFSLILNHSVSRNSQIFNNYAPKGNEELLMGYGFCLLKNPCDQLALRLSRPPMEVLKTLCEDYPKMFAAEKRNGWNDDSGNFYLRGSGHYAKGYENALGIPCLRGIPIRLFLTLLTIIKASEPIISNAEVEEEEEDEEWEQLWCSTLDAILQRLEHKRATIAHFDSSLPAEGPKNAKQAAANIYRDGQLHIIDEIIGEIEDFLAPIEQEEKSMSESFEGVRQNWKTVLKNEKLD